MTTTKQDLDHNEDDDDIYLLTHQAKEYIPSTVRLISACLDEQESADVGNLTRTNDVVLPYTPVGTSGGACTSTLLEVLYSLNQQPKEKETEKGTSIQEQQQSPSKPVNPIGEFFTTIFQGGSSPQKQKQQQQQQQQQKEKDEQRAERETTKAATATTTITYAELIHQMNDKLKQRGYTQIPQLSTSHPMDINNEIFTLVPTSTSTSTTTTTITIENEVITAPKNDITKRALVIGINYCGMKGVELSGCHNDAQNMINYLKKEYKFVDGNITTLMDDNIHTSPTKSNILQAFQNLTQVSQPGDIIVLHYAGHGSKIKDTSGDEDDGYDETMIPVDYQTAGQIIDDDIFMTLIHPLKAGVHMTCIIDCCHSGTILDLPFTYRPSSTTTSTNNARLTCPKGKNRAFPHLGKVRRKKLWEDYKGLIVVGTAVLWVAPVLVGWMIYTGSDNTNNMKINQKA